MPKGTPPSCGTTGSSQHHPDIRGYVIDETVGSVEVMAKFAGAPDSHDFRIENCEVVLVHAVTTTLVGAKSGLTGKGKGKGKGKAGKRS
jgi:phosphoribosyl 1,2-cyclic phosphodiesterase